MSTATRDSKIEVKRLAGSIGARVSGCDITDMTDEQFAQVRAAFDQQSVIVLPGQAHASLDEYVAFASRWGDILGSQGSRLVPDSSSVVLLENMGKKVTDIWHTDLSFLARPPLASMLRAVDVPEAGGDTLFASQIDAYAELSAPYQRMLADMSALHVDIPRGDGKPEAEFLRTEHPVVRTVNGFPALYVNQMYTQCLVGFTPEESRPILNWLFAHCTQPNFTFRHHWDAGDLLIWDNRRVQHFAIHDYGDAVRRMHRLVVDDRDFD